MTVLRIFAVLAFAAGCLSAQTRVAGVDIGRAFSSYHKTQTAMEEIALERVKINEDPRLEQLRALATETKEAEATAERLAGGNDEEAFNAQRFAQLKQQELQASARAIKEARDTATSKLDARFVESSRALLGEVHKTAAEIGSERGFDLVVDTSGKTNTGLPLLLYAKELPDITETVIARLNAAAPTEGTGSGEAGDAESNDEEEGEAAAEGDQPDKPDKPDNGDGS